MLFLLVQMEYLEEWALLERNHISSLKGAVEDLEASTLRLPVTAGARVSRFPRILTVEVRTFNGRLILTLALQADIDTLKNALGSAVDVMQATGFSVRPLHSRVSIVSNFLTNEFSCMELLKRSYEDLLEDY